MIGQFGFPNPLERRAIQRSWFAENQFAGEKFQPDGLFGVGVRNFFKQATDFDFNVEFLAQFADEALLESFARLEFAAGKFPESAEVRAGMAPGDEKFAAMEDERGADFNCFYLLHR